MPIFGFRKSVAMLIVCTYLGSFAMIPAAQASMIPTQTALQQDEHAARVAHVRALLAQDRIAEQMIKLGVDPADVQARVAALSNEQLAQLENRLTDLPAGSGFFAVAGVVFVVLLILELVGAINLFNSI